ncbi:hypothetical protein M0Q97_07705 [Candidatus Dojkabacteria bacterium]|jgi:hypothetical protein|nr:hypothetical protein [Candidatus Dojkabacteria bacterium]
MTKETRKLARKKGYICLFPTDISIQKWLRNKHKININIDHRTHSQTYYFNITGSYHIGENGLLYSELFSKYKTYEKALEKALNEALKLI